MVAGNEDLRPLLPASPCLLVCNLQVTAPKLLDALSAELPAEVAQLRTVFAAFASFGAARSTSTAPTAEMDGVCGQGGGGGAPCTTSVADCRVSTAEG